MKRFLSACLVMPATLFLAGLAGCGKEEPPKVASTTPKLVPSGGGAAGGPKTMIAAGKAKVVGRVVLEGSAPETGSLVPVMKMHKDSAVCLMGSAPELMDQTWLVDKSGGVANVVIWINPPAGSEFEVKKEAGDAVLDQPHCVYVPHVVAVKPGQQLLIKNSAEVAHNTKLDVDQTINRPFGQTIAPKGAVPVPLSPQDKAITAACDFHGWMKAKIWVAQHQYIAVTKADGTFEIDGVPEGKELMVVAWHEGVAAPGYFYGGKKGKAHTFNAGENKLDDIKVPVK